ncbi:MAG: hypothetical protein ACLFQY_21025, partial [Desulfococcaceae bacterium]
REVASGGGGDITGSNAGSEIKELEAESETENPPKPTEPNQFPSSTPTGPDTGSPNPKAPGRHPDTDQAAVDHTEADPVERSIAMIREDVPITAGIRRVVRKGIERHGAARVDRNIGYVNATVKHLEKYRAYLDLSIRGNWGEDFDPKAIPPPPPDPTEVDRKAIAEIEQRRREVEAERAEAAAIGEAFLGLPEPEQARLRAAFLEKANRFERRRAGRMTAGDLARNISFVGFLRGARWQSD